MCLFQSPHFWLWNMYLGFFSNHINCIVVFILSWVKTTVNLHSRSSKNYDKFTYMYYEQTLFIWTNQNNVDVNFRYSSFEILNQHTFNSICQNLSFKHCRGSASESWSKYCINVLKCTKPVCYLLYMCLCSCPGYMFEIY